MQNLEFTILPQSLPGLGTPGVWGRTPCDIGEPAFRLVSGDWQRATFLERLSEEQISGICSRRRMIPVPQPFDGRTGGDMFRSF